MSQHEDISVPKEYVPAAPVPQIQWYPSASYSMARTALCPDLLRLDDIGEADSWRGHVVRTFFRLLRWVTGV